MHFETLETSRMKLLKVSEKELQFMFDNYSSQEIIDFLGLASEEQIETERKKLSLGYNTFNKEFHVFYLSLKGTNKNIGWCGYHTWFRDHNRAELGYMLFDQKWMGKGYMSEALSTVLSYGFDKLQLHRIEALVGRENMASLALLNKNGFDFEGTLKQHYKVGNRYEDSLMYALFAPKE